MTTGLLLLAGAVGTVALVRAQMRRQALVSARSEAQLLLNRNLATHFYFSRNLKPKLFESLTAADGDARFEPAWMSSTYAIRHIDEHFQSLDASRYYYKECAIDARAAGNEADEFERAFLEELNADPTLVEREAIRSFGGESYFTLMRRGEVMERSCLRCHSTPDRAPAGLVEQYGDTRSFHRQLGEVASAISIRIPVTEAYAEAHRAALRLSAWLLALLVGICATLSWLGNRLIFAPLAGLCQKVQQIATNADHLGETIPGSRGYEFTELAGSFNRMSTSLKDSRDRLESRVAARTEELTRANESLRTEIVERKQVEAELAIATQAAEGASRAKSEFLANMSHELRTPMTAILGYADVLLADGGTEVGGSAAETIKRNGEHLLRLINDILDLSKIEAGKMAVEAVRCSPGRIVAEVASLMRVCAEAKNLSLAVEYAGPMPESIVCDPGRLRQILVNLVGNAIKFTDTGGVRIVARLASGEDPAPRLQFDVVDTGGGMTGEQMARIFAPFMQGDASVAQKYGGTGLGLALSLRLARLLGGNITVRSARGKGSTFRATVATGPLDDVPLLPHFTEAVSDRESLDPPGLAPGEPLDCRVLLAEDGPDNQRLVSFLLRRAGAEVTVAENGQLACEQAQAALAEGAPFALILMDMQMPVMDGYTATRQLREAGYAGPIVALTASAMAGDAARCREAGCDGYLAKPIHPQKFWAAIAQYARRSQAPANG